ncbi:MAG: TlpA disulfide reductase family protein [Planctomycetota bacterium]|nr:TlpA disulfide reductase family protein [Planctomycetota bacterium]
MRNCYILALLLSHLTCTFGVLSENRLLANCEAQTQLNELLDQYAANRQSRKFVEKFLALAAEQPNTTASLDALNWVIKRFESGNYADRALVLLAKHHAAAVKLDEVFIYIGNNPSLQVGIFYRQVIAANKNPAILGKAHFRLGIYLMRQLEISREVQAKPEAREKYDLFYGKDLTAYLLAMNHAQNRKEALQHFVVIQQKYASVKTFQGQLGPLANIQEFKLAHLSVGGVAPEITGKDIFGKPLKLSDFRGKIVLLDFWGDWCVACRTLYSFNRTLHQKMEGRHFALVGVNSDTNRDLTRRIMKIQQIQWNNFWDDGSRFGEISTQWGVKTWPVLYVIDGDGIIRLKSVGGHNRAEILRLIEKLTAELEQKQSKSTNDNR